MFLILKKQKQGVPPARIPQIALPMSGGSEGAKMSVDEPRELWSLLAPCACHLMGLVPCPPPILDVIELF